MSGGKGGSNSGGTSKGGGSSKGGASSAGTSSGGGISPGGGVVGVSGSMQGEGGGPVVVEDCMSPSDCDVESACQEATCNSNVCGAKDLPNGAFELQVLGDCQRMDCVDGQEQLVVDLDDNDDKNECTVDSCGQGGVVMHKARYGVVCQSGAGICSAEGKCELCNRGPPASCATPRRGKRIRPISVTAMACVSIASTTVAAGNAACAATTAAKKPEGRARPTCKLGPGLPSLSA